MVRLPDQQSLHSRKSAVCRIRLGRPSRALAISGFHLPSCAVEAAERAMAALKLSWHGTPTDVLQMVHSKVNRAKHLQDFPYGAFCQPSVSCLLGQSSLHLVTPLGLSRQLEKLSYTKGSPFG